jgi:hypothetical protein
MEQTRFNKSIFFKERNGKIRFLFKCVNYGEKDNLKFIFNFPKKGKSVIFSPEDNSYPENIEIWTYAELSYHLDGSLLWKFPKRNKTEVKQYYNPHGIGTRRTRLDDIKLWEPLIKGNIIRYQDCLNEETIESEDIIECDEIFDGTPFEYYLHIGHLSYDNPPNKKFGEFIYRINGITSKLDMILWFRKSDYSGQYFIHGNTTAINDNNRVKMIEPNFIIDQTGAIELDLGLLANTIWNADLVDETMKLNIEIIKNIDSKILLSKSYLKDNPYLNQIRELLGYNKEVVVSPLFRNQKLGIRLYGIIEKENDLDIFILVTI